MNKLIITDELPNKPDDVGLNWWGCVFSYHKDISIPLKARDKLLEVPNGVGTNVNSRIAYISERRTDRINNTQGPEIIGQIVKGEMPEIITSLDAQIQTKKLFSGRPERKELNDYLAVTTVNKYPAGLRCIDEEIYKKIAAIENVAFMPCLMTFTTKYPQEMSMLDDLRMKGQITGDYFQEIEQTPTEHVNAMLASMQASINAYVKRAKDNGINEILIRPFINQGRNAGASQTRLHSQTYIDLTPGHTSTYEALLKGFARECKLCHSDHDGRELYDNGEFKLWVTNSPRRNYHLRIASNQHIQRFTDFNSKQLNGLAEILRIGNTMLSQAGVTKYRNTLFHSLYEGYDTARYHFHVDIVPYYPEGAVELFGDVSVASISPLRAAEQLMKAKTEMQLKQYTY